MSTPTTDPRPLDAFESSLLTELRAVVDERAPAATPARQPRRRRIIGWSAAAGLIAAGAATMLLLPGNATPAYALSQDGSGGVKVTINRLADASALEQDLAAHGVKADVTYLEAGTQCADGRYTDAPTKPGVFSFEASHPAGAPKTSWSMTIPKAMVGSGETLVLESIWPSEDSWAMSVGLAAGPVGACVPVPSTVHFPTPGDAVPSGGAPTAFATAT